MQNGNNKSGADGIAKHPETEIKTPDDALAELIAGNKRFTNGESLNTNYLEQIENTKYIQYPHSVVLTCFDSRVPPEIIFDQGIGNIFTARVAGNIADKDILGSLEFGAKIRGSKLIVVMGHSDCGAVMGAIENAKLGYLTQLVDRIKPAITGSSSDPVKMLDETSRKNVMLTVDFILKNSDVLAEMNREGKVKIVAAYYDTASGKVEFMS